MENIINNVFSTVDYTIFTSLDGNRIVNPLHVKKIVESMKHKVLFIPIIVNEKFQVIDGQHRLEARKLLNLDVPYIVCNDYTLEDVHRANANHKQWSSEDFLIEYAEAGLEEYIFIKDLYLKYKDKVSISTLLRVIKSGKGKQKFKLFKDGLITITDKEYAKSIIDDWYRFYSLITKDGKSFAHIHSIADAFHKLFDIKGFNLATLLSKIERYPNLVESQNSQSQYLYMLDKVYNYRNQHIVVRLKN